ncbi:MAG: selenocysteine-specific translation elongation factor [Gaiellaceae bacterium]
MSLVVGTAGHVDHGKTWLVRALTGKDTDRLPEEQRRGISIELGYAPLELPDRRTLSLVDVPGHERFVRTMVAGATGVDLFLLAIDAGEGARPQTHEHLAILRLLGVERGVVAVTKADAVDAETLELAVAEARELVPGAPVVAVSARTGAGLAELREALSDVAATRRAGRHPPRLFVDRSFSLPGIGTVVTGTLWSGSIGAGDLMRAEPAGLDVRVRSVEVHDQAVERAQAGRRVAVSLPGIERGAIGRGDALVEPGAYPVSYRLDIALDELETVPAHVQVHHGTTEAPARVVRVGERYAQLRLGSPVVAARGDRVVLRTEHTVGGGRVLDPAPPRRPDARRLDVLAADDPVAIARAVAREPLRRTELSARGLLFGDELQAALNLLDQADGWYFAPEWLEALKREVAHRLETHAAHSTLDPGIPLAELLPDEPWAPALLPLLGVERRGAKAYAPGVSAALGERAEAAATLETELEAAGTAGVRVADAALAAFLESEGRLVRLGNGFVVSTAAYQTARRAALDEFEQHGSIRLARYRDGLGVSRGPAQLLLERLDADGVTRRVGDERVVRRSARASA